MQNIHPRLGRFVGKAFAFCHRHRCGPLRLPRFLIPLAFVTATVHVTAQGRAADPSVALIEQVPHYDCSASAAHVIWSSPLGDDSGPLRVHDGRVLVGTRNLAPLPDGQMDVGVMACFDSGDGELLWRVDHPRLRSTANDNSRSAIRSRATVDSGLVYYVSNRGELMCVALDKSPGREGVKSKVAEQRSVANGLGVVWSLDMVEELGVFKRDTLEFGTPLASPVVWDDYVFCVTGNGSTRGRPDIRPAKGDVPKAEAPSFIAVHRKTGAVQWSSNAPGKDIFVGQWASPIVVSMQIGEVVIFPGGDGVLYCFEPKTGKQLWALNCGEPPSRTAFAATPVVHAGRLLVPTGVLNDFYEPGPRPLCCVALDAAASRGDSAIAWRFVDRTFDRAHVALAAHAGIAYALGWQGILVAIDVATGQKLWSADVGPASPFFASPFVESDRLYVPLEQEILVVRPGREFDPVCCYAFENSIPGTPAVLGDKMYVATRCALFGLRLFPER